MGWFILQMAEWKRFHRPDWLASYKMSEMLRDIGLKWYLEPGDEHLYKYEMGARIDHCAVAYISSQLDDFEKGNIGIEELDSRILKIEVLLRDDPNLRDCETYLQRKLNVPLVSRTYLKLAKRHLQREANIGNSDLQRPPDLKEGKEFASIMLADDMIEADWRHDWDIGSVVRNLANRLLYYPDPEILSMFIQDSYKSSVAWDVLQLTCQEVGDRGEKHPSYELLVWYLRANTGHLKRPEEEPAPHHRPPTTGYKLRDNEIRHTVDLMVRVGMPKAAACEAVLDVFQSSGVELSESTIRRVSREPYWTMVDLGREGMDRLGLSFGSMTYWHWFQLPDPPATP